jgi:predicted  nucleic acid-binding Zn-ribbon protein
MEDSLKNLQYVECQNCGTIHYVISIGEANILIKTGELYNEFSDRNLECCVNCGSKNKFLKVSEDYVDSCLHGDKIPPILLKDEESNRTTENNNSV